MNTALNGLSLQEINLGTIAKLKEQAGIHSTIVSDVLDTLAQTLSENEDLQIYTSGATNILKYPELSDSESAANLLSTFEEKDELVNLVTEHRPELDETIGRYTRGWALSRISKISMAILRCALCEILYVEDVPTGTAIDEAVEIAKRYEEPETVSFINGVLGSFVREELDTK